MSFIVPYMSCMRLGQGFNSFTREICIDAAVSLLPGDASTDTEPAINGDPQYVPVPTVSDGAAGDRSVKPAATGKVSVGFATANPSTGNPPDTHDLVPVQHTPGQNQTVVFSCCKVDHVTDLLTTLNVSAYASIKYGTITGGFSGNYVNEKKVTEADLNYIVSVKVTNESSRKEQKLNFNPMGDIRQLDAQTFTSIFGDCFIMDFLEGGEFSAVISVKTGSSASTRDAQAALEAQIQTGIPGLTIGTGSKTDSKKTASLEDADITVSVSWVGGGCIRESTSNWSIADVIRTANYFPNQCARYHERTSAVLMNYNSLRSFRENQLYGPTQSAQSAQSTPNGASFLCKKLILDYTAASIVAKDIFSRYMAWKSCWQKLTNILSDPEAYQPLQQKPGCPKPIDTDPLSLNLARLKCREGMIQCLTEVEGLRNHPPSSTPPVLNGIAGPEVVGRIREKSLEHVGLPANSGLVNGIPEKSYERNVLPDVPGYGFPAELSVRLPRYVGAPITNNDGLWSNGNWTVDEMRVIMPFTADKQNLSFSVPYGDRIANTRGTESKAFCTLNEKERNNKPATLHRLCLHGHEHNNLLGDIFGQHVLHPDLKHLSSRFRGALSMLGLTSSASTLSSSSTSFACGAAAHLPSHNTHKQDPRYFRSVNLSSNGGLSGSAIRITKVEVGYVPGHGCIAALKFWSRNGKGPELEWNMYNLEGMKEKPQDREAAARLEFFQASPPTSNSLDDMPDGSDDLRGATSPVVADSGEWALVGFYGTAHLVVEHIGFIWGRI